MEFLWTVILEIEQIILGYKTNVQNKIIISITKVEIMVNLFMNTIIGNMGIKIIGAIKMILECSIEIIPILPQY